MAEQYKSVRIQMERVDSGKFPENRIPLWHSTTVAQEDCDALSLYASGHISKSKLRMLIAKNNHLLSITGPITEEQCDYLLSLGWME